MKKNKTKLYGNNRKLYKKPSKKWRKFMQENLREDDKNGPDTQNKKRRTVGKRLKTKLPNIRLVAGILLAIAALLLVSCYIKSLQIPRYNLTVNVKTVDQDGLSTTFVGHTVKIVKDEKTVAQYKLVDNIANFTLPEGEYSVEMNEQLKGSIKVKMNMDRSVELRVSPTSY